MKTSEETRLAEEAREAALQRAEDALQGCSVTYRKTKKNSRFEAALDKGHTHFLLVDNGTSGKW